MSFYTSGVNFSGVTIRHDVVPFISQDVVAGPDTIFLDNFNGSGLLNTHLPDFIKGQTSVVWVEPNDNYDTDIGFTYFISSSLFDTPEIIFTSPVDVSMFPTLVMSIGIIWGEWATPGFPADRTMEFLAGSGTGALGVYIMGTNEPSVKEIYSVQFGTLLGTLNTPLVGERGLITVVATTNSRIITIDGVDYTDTSTYTPPGSIDQVNLFAMGPNGSTIMNSHKIDSIHVYGVGV